MHSKSFCILLISLTLVSSVLFAQSPMPVCSVDLINSEGKQITITVQIARTPETRTRGLMFRKHLDEKSGMLFIFESDEQLSFWMKNVTIPLSVAFIDKEFVIKDILHMAPLDDSILYPSSGPVRYALEVNQGFFETNKIKVGNRINISSCLKK